MSDFAKQFEDLRIWQQARVLAANVYRDFGGSKDFGFRDQIQRAGVSVMNNIAEGFERNSPKEFAHLLGVAKGSCGEVRSMLFLAEDLNYLSSDTAQERRNLALSISKGIEALAKKLRSQT
ncbi:MAG: four helix bundle protein [Verrucomicrobiota bacterium]